MVMIEIPQEQVAKAMEVAKEIAALLYSKALTLGESVLALSTVLGAFMNAPGVAAEERKIIKYIVLDFLKE